MRLSVGFRRRRAFQIDGFLLALIICINAIRYLVNEYESGIFIYGIFVLFIITVIVKNANNKSILIIDKSYGKLFFLCIVMIIIGGVSVIEVGGSTYVEIMKLCMEVLIIYCVLKMDIQGIEESFSYMIFICTIYVLVLLAFPNRIYEYMERGSNYLVLTLPIGLVLSVLLSKCIEILFEQNKNYKKIVVYLVLAIVYFISLTRFTGRASIIFPFLVALIVTLVRGRKHFLKFIKVGIILVIAILAAFYFFVNYADAYFVRRMMSLFMSNSSEDRWVIWSEYITYIREQRWYIWGGGVGSSVREVGYYPHNFYLQLLGEFGIIGLLVGFWGTRLLLKKQFIIFKMSEKFNREYNHLFYMCFAAFVYLFLNYMKSFTIYDASGFCAMYGVMLRICDERPNRLTSSSNFSVKFE